MDFLLFYEDKIVFLVDKFQALIQLKDPHGATQAKSVSLNFIED